MVHRATGDFWRKYHALPPIVQSRADNQFFRLTNNPGHASLQFKKIGVRYGQEVWSVRVTLSYRAAALKRDYGFLWFWIGNHDAYDSLIS